jgi:hypothetical protein
VIWLKENVEKFDPRFHFVHWDVHNAMYNPAGPLMTSYQRLPVTGFFDLVMAYSLFTHLEPQDSTILLRLAREVVRPSGFFFFTAFCDRAVTTFEDRVPDHPLLNAYYNPEYLCELVRRAGWEVLSYSPPSGYMMDSFLCRRIESSA